MATLDEVVAEMLGGDYIHDPIQFVIDSDLRVISIPRNGVVAGVVGDKNVNRVNFQMPRYYNGFDMSKFTTRVNYINALGNFNYYSVTDLTIEDDLIYFTWLVDSDVVAYAGIVMFAVNMFIADSNGKITQSFNTSNKGLLNVLEGIQVNEYVTPEEQEDILTRLEADISKYVNSGINQIDTVTNESIQKIQVESTKATASISDGLSKIATRTDESVKKVQDEGEKVKSSIPTDYTELTETVSDLETQSSNLDYEVNSRLKQFYKYSKGATEINDSDNGRLHNLKVYGRSEQAVTTGAQLLGSDTVFIRNTDDVSIPINNPYEVSWTHNTNVPIRGVYLDNVKPILANKQYTISFDARFSDGNSHDMRCVDTDKICVNGKNSILIKIHEKNSTVSFYTRGNITKGLSVTISNIMLEEGSTAHDFEPYTGGIPSPNPDYPQEIKSVVNPTVKVCGKNLFQPLMPTTTVDGVTVTNNGDGTYTLNGTAIADATFRLDQSGYGKVDNLKKYKGTYTFSRSNTSYDARVMRHNTWEQVMYLGIGSQSITKKIDIDDCFVFISTSKGTTYNNVLVDLQIELGSTPTAYEPYHEQTVTLPYTLNAIPVNSGGNVTIDGQQYVADYVDVERGKLVKMVDSSKLDNTQSIVDKTEWLLAEQQEIDLIQEEVQALKTLATYYPTTNIFINSEQLDGYTVFNYPIPFENEWIKTKKDVDSLKEDIGDLNSSIDSIKEIGLSSKVNFSTGGLNPSNGSITDNAERLHSDIIFVRKGSTIKLKPNKKLKFAVYKYGDLLGNEFISAAALSLDDYIFTDDCYIRILIESGDTTLLKDIDFNLFSFDLNELNNRVKYTELTEWVNRGYIAISDVNDYTKFAIKRTAEWSFMVLPVHSGDKFIVYGYGGNNSKLYAFTDRFGKVLKRTEKVNVMQKLVITSPSDGYVIFNVLRSNEHQVIKFNTNVINENNKRNLIVPPYIPSAYNPILSVPNGQTTAMKYEEIMESWNNLQKKYPNYISKTNLGKETSGILDMYRYDFIPEIVPLEASVQDGMNKIYTKNDYPIVIMGACIHGAERPCAKALLNLMTLIANAKDYSILGWLRNNIHFVIIPLENPWGYKNDKRTNVNHVDLNRNFEPFWEKGDSTIENERYRGTSPLSEKEAQYIDSILKECADKAVCYYSFHTHGVFTSYSMMTNFSSPALFLLNDMQNIGMSVTKMITSSGWTNHNLPEDSGYIGCMEMEYGAAMASYQGAKYNIPSACPEVMYRYYDGGTGEVYNTDLDCMNTEYILYAVANACEKFLYGN